MALIPLALFKGHVRADDFAGDDDYLTHLLSAAEAWALKAVNREEDEMLRLGGGELPADYVQGVMLVAAHWYNMREGGGGGAMAEVPYTISAIFKPYTRLT